MSASVVTPTDALARLLDQIRQRHSVLMAASLASAPAATSGCNHRAAGYPLANHRGWPDAVGSERAKAPGTTLALQARLQAFGLLPEHAAQVAQQAAQLLQPRTATPEAQWEAARTVLARHWRQPPAVQSTWQVWLGAPGAGTTTCLSKWLVRQAVQTSPRLQVWRLDLLRANTAEALTIVAEACGVPVKRTWPQPPQVEPGAIQVVDLPGLDWQEPNQVAELQRCITQLPEPQVHLVLNAAYEVPIWLAQIRALASLPIADLTFSHLDEQPHWGKLWNAVLGTQLPLAFLSAGQNVPGQWRAATPKELLPRQGPAADAAPHLQPC